MICSASTSQWDIIRQKLQKHEDIKRQMGRRQNPSPHHYNITADNAASSSINNKFSSVNNIDSLRQHTADVRAFHVLIEAHAINTVDICHSFFF